MTDVERKASNNVLRVIHETVYEYGARIESAHHLAHLKPLETDWQRVQAFTLHVQPEPLQLTESCDSFGNAVHYFSLHAPHETLCVVAHSCIEMMAPVSKPSDSPAWDAVRDGLVYRARMPFEPAAEYLFGSQYAPVDARLADYAGQAFVPGRPLLEASDALMRQIHREFSYDTKSTQVTTGAIEALKLRKGVCQDFSHVMIGALRTLGLPARYVSGYLLTQPPPDKPRLIGADASHAWVSVYCPEIGWVDFDPTNDRQPGDDYVTLAVGRDYTDVAPLKGVIRGGGPNQMLKVAVTVMPELEAQALDLRAAIGPRG